MQLLLILERGLEGKVGEKGGVAGDNWRESGKEDAEERNTTRSFVSFFLREGGGGALVPSYMLKINTLFTFIICIIHMCLYDTFRR